MCSSRMNNSDYHSSLQHHHVQYPTHHYNSQGSRTPYSPSYNNNNHTDYFQSRPSSYHNTYPVMITPKEEEMESSTLGPRSSPLDEDDERSDYSPSAMNSPSMSHTGSSFSRDSSPMNDDLLGSMSEASASMTSLISSTSSASSSSGSMTPVPTTTQLLLCPVCGRAFKPSKNQNCNLRRHLKNVHSMSPTMHPRKCKWDSLPDGRVKDDKDRKERTRKSKRLWARKFRQRRKVEEAAVVLSMLSQAL
ncbi:hypothetical protein BGZ76_009745 [Entomortierella beljakovae]|nr:hypothetical protein BGZ76_009745 [Entomortierella beljakovae]